MLRKKLHRLTYSGLKELREDFNLDEPIAFKVRISKDDQFTRINLRKIETLKEAKKEKIKTKQKAIVEPPITVAVNFTNDDRIMYDLFDIIANNQGKRELKLLVKSKLGDIELDSGFKVTSNIENLVKSLDGVFIAQ